MVSIEAFEDDEEVPKEESLTEDANGAKIHTGVRAWNRFMRSCFSEKNFRVQQKNNCCGGLVQMCFYVTVLSEHHVEEVMGQRHGRQDMDDVVAFCLVFVLRLCVVSCRGGLGRWCQMSVTTSQRKSQIAVRSEACSPSP